MGRDYRKRMEANWSKGAGVYEYLVGSTSNEGGHRV